MPTGPRGEKRPPDVIANAVHVAKIATGEAEEAYAESHRKSERTNRSPSRTAGTRTRNLSVRKADALSIELQPHRGG